MWETGVQAAAGCQVRPNRIQLVSGEYEWNLLWNFVQQSLTQTEESDQICKILQRYFQKLKNVYVYIWFFEENTFYFVEHSDLWAKVFLISK